MLCDDWRKYSETFKPCNGTSDNVLLRNFSRVNDDKERPKRILKLYESLFLCVSSVLLTVFTRLLHLSSLLQGWHLKKQPINTMLILMARWMDASSKWCNVDIIKCGKKSLRRRRMDWNLHWPMACAILVLMLVLSRITWIVVVIPEAK